MSHNQTGPAPSAAKVPESRHLTPDVSPADHVEEAVLPVGLLALQRMAGNQAVQRFVLTKGLDRGTGAAVKPPQLQRHDGPTILSPEGEEDKVKAKAAKKTPAEKKKEQVWAILEKSPAGKHAIACLEKYKVPIDFEYPGPGSVFQGPAPGKIKVLATKTAEQAAFTLVHEANHAESSNLGTKADINKMDRATYVKSMLDEEASSTVNAILAKVGMSAGDRKGLKADPLLMARYEKARKDAIDAKKTDAEAEKAAWQSIRDAFTDGSLVTSNTKEAYDIYYGKAWDKVNKPPAKDVL